MAEEKIKYGECYITESNAQYEWQLTDRMRDTSIREYCGVRDNVAQKKEM